MPTVNVQVENDQVVDVIVKPHVVAIGGGGSGGADFAQNDPNGAGYIANRPLWKEVKGENIAVLPQTDIAFTSDSKNVMGFAENSFIEGNKYIVMWNGTAHETWCYVDDATFYLGNGELAGVAHKTADPFCIVSMGGSLCFVYKDTTTAETITLKVDGVQETIYHQLDPKYIPNMYYTEERQDAEILPTSPAIDTGNAMMGELYVIGSPITLEVGKTYKVIYNGTEYESVASEFTLPQIGLSVGLGDVDVVTTGTPSGAYPFALAVNDLLVQMGACAAVIPLDGSTSITVSIVGYGEIIHKIPEKFLPDNYGANVGVLDLPEDAYVDLNEHGSYSTLDTSIVNRAKELAKKCDKIILRFISTQGEVHVTLNKALFGLTGEVSVYGFSNVSTLGHQTPYFIEYRGTSADNTFFISMEQLTTN